MSSNCKNVLAKILQAITRFWRSFALASFWLINPWTEVTDKILLLMAWWLLCTNDGHKQGASPSQCCWYWLWSIETLLSWALCPTTPHNCTWPIKNIHINEDTFRSLGFEMTSNGFSNNHKCKIEISIPTSLKTIASKYFLTCDLAWSIRAMVQLQTTLVTRSCAVFRWSDGGRRCGQ